MRVKVSLGLPNSRIGSSLLTGTPRTTIHKDHYSTNARNVSYFGTQVYGIAALDARTLADSKGVYPEN